MVREDLKSSVGHRNRPARSANLSRLVDRSRCHSLFVGSAAANRSAMASDAVYAARAAARSPSATAASPTRSWEMDRSRCQPLFVGSAAANRCRMTSDAVYAARAATRSPSATATSPSLSWETDRSRTYHYDFTAGWCLELSATDPP